MDVFISSQVGMCMYVCLVCWVLLSAMVYAYCVIMFIVSTSSMWVLLSWSACFMCVCLMCNVMFSVLLLSWLRVLDMCLSMALCVMLVYVVCLHCYVYGVGVVIVTCCELSLEMWC